MSADSSNGNLPTGWSAQSLSLAAEVVMGQSPPGTSYNEDGVGAPFFQGKAEFGQMYPTVRKWTTTGNKHAKVGDILLSVRAPVGPTNVADIDCVIGRGLAAIRAKNHMNQIFLLWFLRSFEHEIAAKGTGTTFDSISGDALRNQLINVPPLAEQEKIVEILEEQLSRLDAALASISAVREKAARFRRSLLHAAFTGALTSQDSSTAKLPNGWKKATIADVAYVSGGRTPTKFEQRLADSKLPNRNIPFYKVGDMNSALRYLSESRVYFAESETTDFGIEILKVGTVVFPKTGGAIATNKKRILEIPGAIDLNCMGVTANGVLHEKLLYWFFESFNLSSIADGTVLPQISKKKVSALEIAFPINKDEQAKLLIEIEAQISKSEAIVQVINEAEKRSSALRRSLLHAAFTGNLTREWRENSHV
jgi:type I restriction enzyme S subunit